MAPAIKKVKSYLETILDPDTEPRQAKVLLGTANSIQLKALTEIFVNILSLDTKGRPNLRRTLKRNELLITTIASTDRPVSQKMSAIQQHVDIVYNLVIYMRSAILDILSK